MDMKELEKLVAADEDGVVITIHQKNGDPYLAADGTNATMTVVGSESKRYKAAKRATTDRMLNKRRSKLSAVEVEKNAISQAAAAVIDWHGWEKDGNPLKCTPENVRLVLGLSDYILDQVQEGITGHTDFSGESSST